MTPESLGDLNRTHEENFQSALDGALRRLDIHELNRIQRQALDEGLLEGANLIVVAPSGSGKTLIGLIAALKLLVETNANRKAVFLVPLKALAHQLFNLLRQALGYKGLRVVMNTGDFSPDLSEDSLANCQAMVVTYERFDSLIRSKVWWLKRISLVVTDEINYLSHKRRGPRLESTIIRLKENLPDVQLIALCPPIRNACEVANWLGCKLIRLDRRPVALYLDVTITSNKVRSAIALSLRSISQGGSVIVFTNSRSRSEQIAFLLSKALRETLTVEERTDTEGLSSTLLKNNDEIPTVTRKLASLIADGVSFHHAGLKAEERNIVEEGFRKRIIKAIVCTTTLGTGINTPASMVIITDTSYVESESHGAFPPLPLLRRVEPDRLDQMLGRAGRLGYDTSGHGVILVDSIAEQEFVKRMYFDQDIKEKQGPRLRYRLPLIESRMNEEDAMLEQLLIRIHELGECGESDLLDYLSKTLWWKTRNKRDSDVNLLLRADSFDIQGLLRLLSSPRREEDNKNHHKRTFVRILDISRERIEARVMDEGGRIWISCSFDSSRGARCDCQKMHLKHSEAEWNSNGKLCKHLLGLARYALHASATRLHSEDIIFRSLSTSLPLDRLVSSGLVTIVDRKYECTELGHITATSYLHVLTTIFIKNAFAELHTDTRLEVESMINIVLRALIIESGERLVMNQRAVMKAIVEWIDERNEETITGSKALAPGDFHELIVEVARLANAAANVARLLGLVNLSKDLSTIGKRIRFGVREELLPLVELSIPSIGRKSARALYDLGYTGLDELGRASVEELAEVVKLHESTASMIIEYVARIINHRQLASLS